MVKSGGVTQMESFLSKFFPEVVISGMKSTKRDAYCKYDNQWLTVFIPSTGVIALGVFSPNGWVQQPEGDPWVRDI